jgi:hypothetical protein
MAAPIPPTHLNTIGCRITVRISEAIKNNELPDDELPELCAYLAVALKDIRTDEELMRFLVVLSARWPFLKSVSGDITGGLSTLSHIEEAFAQRAAFAKT